MCFHVFKIVVTEAPRLHTYALYIPTFVRTTSKWGCVCVCVHHIRASHNKMKRQRIMDLQLLWYGTRRLKFFDILGVKSFMLILPLNSLYLASEGDWPIHNVDAYDWGATALIQFQICGEIFRIIKIIKSNNMLHVKCALSAAENVPSL